LAVTFYLGLALWFESSEKNESRRLTGLLKEKSIRKIAPRIYTSNLEEESVVIVKRNWYRILAHLFPFVVAGHPTRN